MMKIGKKSLFAIVLLWFFSLKVGASSVVDCTANMTDVVFGEVDFITSPSAASNSASLFYKCTNNSSVAQHISLCFYINGSNKPTGYDDRWHSMKHKSAGEYMLFQLQDVATGNAWGTKASGLAINIKGRIPANGQMSANKAINGILLAKQKNLPAGSYFFGFSSGNIEMTWSTSPVSTPNNCDDYKAKQTFSFSAYANIPKSCNVTAQNMDFGQVIQLNNQMIDAQSDITVQCTNKLEYGISLRSMNTQGEHFYMRANNAESGRDAKIPYMLYQDPARTIKWGDGKQQKTAIGTGSIQRHPVYGRVVGNKSTIFPSGLYQDTVIVSLSF